MRTSECQKCHGDEILRPCDYCGVERRIPPGHGVLLPVVDSKDERIKTFTATGISYSSDYRSEGPAPKHDPLVCLCCQLAEERIAALTASLKGCVDQLEKRGKHDSGSAYRDGCAAIGRPPSFRPSPCDCGLLVAIERAEALLKEKK